MREPHKSQHPEAKSMQANHGRHMLQNDLTGSSTICVAREGRKIGRLKDLMNLRHVRRDLMCSLYI